MDSKAIKIGYLAICLVAAVLTTMTISSVLAGSAAEDISVTARDEKGNVAHDTYSVTVHENASPAPTPTPPTQLPPEIVGVETFREGDMVFFKLFFTDPNNDAVGFGFRGAKGSGWAEETFPFSSPSYGRVSPGRIEYPFNHRCETGPAYESDVEAWIYDSAGLISPSVTVHLSCQLPAPTTTPTTKLPIDKKETLGPYDICHKYYIHIFSVDDVAKAIVNGKQIAQINYLQDSGWIDITNYLIEGSNTIEFTEENAPTGGWTYGFEIRQDDSKIIWRDQCGDTGTWGCMNDDQTRGLVYRDILTLTITPTTPTTGLAFPLKGYTPYNASVTSIMDHSMTTPYAKDGIVRAFDGEEGVVKNGCKFLNKVTGERGFCDSTNYSKNKDWIVAYNNSQGTIFLPQFINYNDDYLYYDGHPGYDYGAGQYEDIFAPANGTLCVALNDNETAGKLLRDPKNCLYKDVVDQTYSTWNDLHTFYIIHEGLEINGVKGDYITAFLHSYDLETSVRAEIEKNGYVKVSRNQHIAEVGDIGARGQNHTHLEVFKRNGTIWDRVDPYGDGINNILWEYRNRDSRKSAKIETSKNIAINKPLRSNVSKLNC